MEYDLFLFALKKSLWNLPVLDYIYSDYNFDAALPINHLMLQCKENLFLNFFLKNKEKSVLWNLIQSEAFSH